MSRLRRILHATDFSPASSSAFARAVAIAKADRAELLLVHVSAPQVFTANGEYIFSQKMYDDLEASARKYGQAHLESLRAKARKAGVRVKTVLLEGLADQQILRAGKSKKADLIVMGTHGRRGLAKFFLGSVASRVVAGSRCPVLTVRGR